MFYLANAPPEDRTPGMDVADWLIGFQPSKNNKKELL
jgi:hypothetical protein